MHHDVSIDADLQQPLARQYTDSPRSEHRMAYHYEEGLQPNPSFEIFCAAFNTKENSIWKTFFEFFSWQYEITRKRVVTRY